MNEQEHNVAPTKIGVALFWGFLWYFAKRFLAVAAMLVVILATFWYLLNRVWYPR